VGGGNRQLGGPAEAVHRIDKKEDGRDERAGPASGSKTRDFPFKHNRGSEKRDNNCMYLSGTKECFASRRGDRR